MYGILDKNLGLLVKIFRLGGKDQGLGHDHAHNHAHDHAHNHDHAPRPCQLIPRSLS